MTFLRLTCYVKSPGKILGKKEQNWLVKDSVKLLLQSPDSKRIDGIITKPVNTQFLTGVKWPVLTKMSYIKLKTMRSLNLIQATGFCFLSPASLKVKSFCLSSKEESRK